MLIGFCSLVVLLTVVGLFHKEVTVSNIIAEDSKLNYTLNCARKASVGFCDCSYNYFQNKLGPEGFEALTKKYNEDKVFTSVMLEAVVACAN
jgi:hypothetical protein